MLRQDRLEKSRHLIKISEIRELHLRLINLFRAVQRDMIKRLSHDDGVVLAEVFNEKLEEIRERIDDFGIPWENQKKRGRGPDKKPRTRRTGVQRRQMR